MSKTLTPGTLCARPECSQDLDQKLTAGYVKRRYEEDTYLQCSREFRFNNKYRLPAFNGTCVWCHLEWDRLEENRGELSRSNH
jgi:hypothetical protein